MVGRVGAKSDLDQQGKGFMEWSGWFWCDKVWMAREWSGLGFMARIGWQRCGAVRFCVSWFGFFGGLAYGGARHRWLRLGADFPMRLGLLRYGFFDMAGLRADRWAVVRYVLDWQGSARQGRGFTVGHGLAWCPLARRGLVQSSVARWSKAWCGFFSVAGRARVWLGSTWCGLVWCRRVWISRQREVGSG